ncbi:hypothetical protein [Devosia sp. Root635]|uniref:hypothetical protein n=1 Tax=Devosia sp. Root635 TaxID=1736575 RepID=UPI0006F857E6|nr:hypothetical protein [Devosia sp. Root635]KRA44701.1 hypothetical protein ASD80_06045 [Devosia sp. Root635]
MPDTWPITVRHKPLAGSPQITPFRAPLATDMEDGMQRRRRSTTKNVATMAMRIPMTAAEHATFEAWVRDTLADGTLDFTMPVWKGGSYADRTCSLVGGLYQSASRGSSGFEVSFNLDIEDY